MSWLEGPSEVCQSSPSQMKTSKPLTLIRTFPW